MTATRKGAEDDVIQLSTADAAALGLPVPVSLFDDEQLTTSVSLETWKAILGSHWFDLPINRNGTEFSGKGAPSFRQLIGYFARRRKAGGLDTIEKNVSAELDVHLILDNYGTHKTLMIRNWLAKRPRFHLHFTPTSASWLNLVERWFAALTDKQLRRGVHRSTKELEDAIETFIQHHNQDPKPFVWHKTADQILDSVARFCKRTLDSGH